MPATPTCILAYTGEEKRYRPLDNVAMEAAKKSGARLIFYDADAASRLGAAGASPLPTVWSGEGEQEQFSNLLGPKELEKAGRAWLNHTVELARAEGIDAYGWLPSSNSAESLSEYAQEQGADLIFVPKDLDQSGLTAWLKGLPTLEAIESEVQERLVTVDLDTADTAEVHN
jgi:nucleotide-binding universal stress UspA family protein